MPNAQEPAPDAPGPAPAGDPDDAPVRRLVEGPFPSALEPALIEEVAAARAAAGPLEPVCILTGSNLLGTHLRRTLARVGRERGIPGLGSAVWTPTFRDLALHVLDAAGIPVRELPGGADLLIAADLARDLGPGPEGGGHPFARVADRPGFHTALAGALRDLRDAGVGPDDLRAQAADPSDRPALLAPLLEAWAERLERAGMTDGPGILHGAAAAVAGVDTAALLPGGARGLVAYGFYDLTGSQWSVLQAMAARVPVTAFVPAGDDAGAATVEPRQDDGHDVPVESDDLHDPWSFARPLRRDLRAAGFAPVAAAPPDGAASDLGHLQGTLFTGGSPAPGDGDDSVRILAAPGAPREEREIAREVVRAAHDGTPLAECLVTVRLPEDRASAVHRRVAQAVEEPERAVLLGGLPAADTPAGRASLRLLDLVDAPRERRHVADLLAAAPLAPMEDIEPGDDAGTTWDHVLREAGVVRLRRPRAGDRRAPLTDWRRSLDVLARSLEAADEDAERDADGEEAGDAEGRSVIRRADVDAAAGWLGALEGALDALDDGGERLPWEWAEAAADLVEQVVAEPAPAAGILRGLGAARGAAAALDSPAEPWSAFRRRARSALEGAGTPGPGPGDGVLVAGVMAARGVRADVVVVGGLESRVFPSNARTDPLLGETLRRRLNMRVAGRADGPLALASRRPAEERLLFMSLVLAARRRLVLTWSRLDETGVRPQVAGSFLVDAVHALTGRRPMLAELDRGTAAPGRLRRVALGTWGAPDGPDLDWVDRDERTVERARNGNDGSVLLDLAHAGARLLPAAMVAEGERWDHDRLGPATGVLDDAVARLVAEHAPLDGPVSPTRLEGWLTCPRTYLYRRILDLAALEEPAEREGLEPRDLGTLFHRIAEDLVRDLRDAGLDWAEMGTEDLRGRAMQTVADVAEHWAARNVTGRPLMWRLERERLEAGVLAWLSHELADADTWSPAHVEWTFGAPPRRADGEGTGEPLRVPLPDGAAVEFTGSADRVDRHREDGSLRVVDYKTGSSKSYTDNSLRKGRRLQLAVYGLAASRLLDADLVQACYRFVPAKRSDKVKDVVFTEDGWLANRDAPAESGEGTEDDGRVAGDLPADVAEAIALAASTVVQGVRSGDFHADPEAGSCDWCDFEPVCGAARRALFQRKVTDPAIVTMAGVRERLP